MPLLQLYFLGPPDIRCDDRPLPKPPTLKSQSLLAYLVLHRAQPQPRERLATLFWGDRPESRARRSLATALWHIRRNLPGEGYVLSDLHTVQFDPRADLWLDVEAFEAGIAHDDPARVASAVALYRGEFLDGFYDDWILNERYRLDSLFSTALARLMAAQEARGEVEAALATALRLLGHDPLREEAHRLAMRAYCRLGQRNAALEQYRRCRQVVAAELGAEPMVETAELHRAILEGRYPVGPARDVRPVQAVAEPALPPGRNPLDDAAPSRLVGRERELAFLAEHWKRAEAGQGWLAFIGGEAGVGKTRLVQEFASRLRWQGARVLWGRCYEFERLLPYQPLSEALRTSLPAPTAADLAGCPPWALAQVARLVPEMAEHGPELETAPVAEASQEQGHLFEGVACFLRQLASRQPILLVVEDLHWASESTLQMLHYLARHLADQSLALLATLRAEAVGRRHPLRALQRQLHQEGLAHLLHLPRLSAQAVEAMVVEMSGAGAAVGPLASRLYRETEGNPFFLFEIVKALFETGALRMEAGAGPERSQGSWSGDFLRISTGDLPLPTSLSEAIQARVDALDDDAQEVLLLAAVLGRELDFDLLNALHGRAEGATLEALDLLLRRRLLEEGSGALGRDYAFTHHKIQEVVYAGLSRQRRQHAHAQAGAAMERLRDGAEREALAGELAHHFEQGRGLDRDLTGKAVAYLLQAGDRARGLYAHQEAIDYYQRALALLKEQGEYERAARTLMKLGLTYHTAFDFRRSRQAYEDGFALWQRAGEQPRGSLPPAPHALRLNWPDPPSLDPGRADSSGSHGVIDQLFCGLVELSPEMEILPSVARTWEVLDGGRRYLFHLREDVIWSDGAPVTAHDFAYAWKRALDPATGSTVADLLYEIKGATAFHHGEHSDPDRVGVRVLDDLTLAVELEGPTGYFLYLLANHVTWPVPQHVVEACGLAWTDVGNLVTNGPFKLAAWHRGESMVLTRSPVYRGRYGGNVHQVELTLLPAGKVSLAQGMYEAGKLDAMRLARLAPLEMDTVWQGHPGEAIRVPTLTTTYLGFDLRRPPFNDVRVRRALVLATDQEALANVALRGYELPASGGFVPPGMPGFSPGIALPYDPDRARHLLADAGYPGGRGFPQLEAVALNSRLPHARYLQAQWSENLGIEIPWELQDLLTWDMPQSNPPPVFVLGWLADYPDPDNFLRTSTVPWCIGWGNPACERMIEEARRVTDQAQRMRLYQEAEKMLLDEARIVPLTYSADLWLVKPWVSRYPTSAMGTYFWKDVVLELH